MKFFLLQQPKAGSLEDRLARSDALKEEGFNVGDCVRCPTCNRPLSMLKWLPPYRIELETWGKHYADVVEVGNDLIVSERFMQAFIKSRLTGLLSFEPVEVIKVVHRRTKPNGLLPRYYKAPVARSSTAIDQELSGYVWEDKSKVCPDCLFDTLKRYRSLIVNEATWSGEDVFYPRGGNGPLVSERFKAIVEDYGLQGIVFVPAESPETGYDSYPWETETASKN
jgi:hypothetical protein